MKLIVVRHGETEWNRQRREQGHLDSPLTENGVRQAEALARRLGHLTIDALYSSDLGRAVQTAEVIGAACKQPVRLDQQLRERHMGVFQGLTWDEMSLQFPQERAEYERTGFFRTIPEGETAEERRDRSIRVLTAIAERHPHDTVVVVTHGGFLMGFLEFVLGIPSGSGTRFKKDNGSFNSFEYDGLGWCLRTWNDLSHLESNSAPMWIMISGPYRSGSSDPTTWANNLEALNRAAYAVFKKGHVPIIAVNLALPIINAAGAETYADIMMPLSLSLVERCDAVLRVGGASKGADQEVQAFRARGMRVFQSLDDIPVSIGGGDDE
ncbi:MAG: histidine phosphatase family protein [Vicinamibacterales bacterium]